MVTIAYLSDKQRRPYLEILMYGFDEFPNTSKRNQMEPKKHGHDYQGFKIGLRKKNDVQYGYGSIPGVRQPGLR
jgi:hypothetical protein